MIVLVTIVAAVAVPVVAVIAVVAVVAVVAVAAVVAVTAVAVGGGVLDALLEPGDAVRDVARLVRVEPVARGAVQPVLDPPRLRLQPVGRIVADEVAAVEPLDLPLDRVDPPQERAPQPYGCGAP
jgi:hypothetical protein